MTQMDPGQVRTRAAKFNNKNDAAPVMWVGSLHELLGEHTVTERKDGLLFSPADYGEAKRRLNKNVEHINFLVYDLDEITPHNFLEIQNNINKFAHIYYTTFSHSPEKPKYRVIFPLSTPLGVKEFPEYWRNFNLKYMKCATDAAAKDLARMYYLPSCSAAMVGDARIEYVTGQVLTGAEFVVSEGQRNTALIKLGGSLRRSGATAEEILARLTESNATFEVPLSDVEVESVAASAARYEVHPTARSGRAKVPRNKEDQVVYTPAVLRTIFTEDSEFAGKLSLNMSDMRPYWKDEPVTETILTGIWMDLIEAYPTPKEIRYSHVEQALVAEASRAPFHPVRRYLDGLEWDGQDRLGVFAEEVFCNYSEVVKMYVRRWLISAVARVLEPGCKVDTVLLLVGEQAKRKSTFFASLCPERSWFSDSGIDLQHKDSYMQIRGPWIYEFGEIDSLFRRQDIARVRAFLSSSVDTFRAPFAKTVCAHPRTGVLGATSNDPKPLKDKAGNRRFFTVYIEADINIEWLVKHRNQIWAQATQLYRAGEQWHLTPTECEEQVIHNEPFEEIDLMEEQVIHYMNIAEAKPDFEGRITLLELCEGLGFSLNIPHRLKDVCVRVLHSGGYRARKTYYKGKEGVKVWVNDSKRIIN